MLHIYICDDIPEQADNIQTIISDLIMFKNWDVRLHSAFYTPEHLLSAISSSSIPGLYLLDIELHASMDGLQLAQKIRALDPSGFIVFITTHDECISVTFQYHLEVLDYVIKDSETPLKDSLKDILNSAYNRYMSRVPHQPNLLSFKSGSQIHIVNMTDILYIESIADTHQTRIHTMQEQISGFEPLKNLLHQLNDSFFLCHRSYIVNLQHIAHIDTKKRTLTLDSGTSLPASVRQFSKLAKIYCT